MTAVANGSTLKSILILFTFVCSMLALQTGPPCTGNATSMIVFSTCTNRNNRTPNIIAFRSHLSPGGYIEQAELSPVPKSDDGSIGEDGMWDEWGKLAVESGVRFGKTMQIQEMMKDLIEEAGFVDVVEKKYKWPIGAWSNDQKLKDIGRWNMHHWKEGLEGWTMALLTRVMGVGRLLPNRSL